MEPLDPVFHYRTKYFMGKTKDVENKDQVGAGVKGAIDKIAFFVKLLER